MSHRCFYRVSEAGCLRDLLSFSCRGCGTFYFVFRRNFWVSR